MTVTREVPHGTPNGYQHYGCRCDECRAAKAAYASDRGYNRRVGKRREQKDRAEAKLRHPCANGCGRLCRRGARLCRACFEAELLAHRQKVERLWAAGVSARDIGREMGWTMSNPGSHIAELRSRGYDLPPRRVLSAEHRAMLVESLARARAARGKTVA